MKIKKILGFTEIELSTGGGYIIPPGNDDFLKYLFRDILAREKDKAKEARFL